MALQGKLGAGVGDAHDTIDRVTGDFNIRGGIKSLITATYRANAPR